MARRKAAPDDVLPRLQETCQQYRQSLLVRGKVTRAEIEAVWPGGAENEDRTTWGWVRCYGSLRAMLGRLDPKVVDFETEKRRRLILDAMAETPEALELTSFVDGPPADPVGEVARRVVYVFPKSDVALTEIHNRNLVLARLVDDAEVLRAHADTPEDVALLIRATEEQTYLQRLICWIATAPGYGLPYPERTERPELPESVRDLSTIDYYLIAEAFQRVNVLRLAALHDSQTSAKRPDWPVFFATLAGELGGDMTAARLMRDRSLAALLAEAAERARGLEEAHQRATRDARTPAAPVIPVRHVGATGRGA